MSSRPDSNRFYALDLLRGFFIVTIIVDHLSRWPSIFGVLSGKALLWVTAAEGFVIISGLLVGYIRGYKSKAKALKEVTFSLWRRALTLYIWAVIGSVIYTAAIWYIPLVGGAPGMPYPKGDWLALIFGSISLSYTFLWVYFLKLYAIFLAASPLAIWLLRKGKAWLVVLLSFLALALGWLTGNEILQWQFVFFVPVVAGYYLTAIQTWWKSQTKGQRRSFAVAIISTTAITATLSVISTYAPEVSTTLDRTNTTIFAKDSISLLRAVVAFLWFTAYLLIFIYCENFIRKALGWLLLPIGTRSLTAYILHGSAIITISFIFATSNNMLINSLLGILGIMIVWVLLKIPGINKVIPR
jgi:hypothetical protein